MVIAIDQKGVSVRDGEVERVRQARRKLHQVREILISPSPEKLGECGPVLEDAAGLLGSLLESRTNGAAPPLLAEELQGLRRELSVVTALMQQAAGYYLGWAQMLGAATNGYTNHGEAAPLVDCSQLSIARSHLSVVG
jgi:hypothetical protein